MTARRVVVTGLGAVTACGVGGGRDPHGLLRALEAPRSRVRRITRFDASPFRSRIAAEIDGFDPVQYMEARLARRLDRFAQLAVAAGYLALADGELPAERLPHDTAVYVGSALGGIAFAEGQHARFVERGLRGVDPALALAVFGGSGATALAQRFGVRGAAVGNANSCASGAVAIGEALRLIRAGDADVALAGGAEAPLAPLTFGAFTAIRATSARNDDPERACRPFDSARDGFVMGEGAAILVLEELGHAIRRGAPIYAELCGYGTTNDAYHPTVPRPDGSEAERAMRLALRDGGAAPEEVDHVNAHGSSTPLGDRAETIALMRLFGERVSELPVSATKALYGHPLGASGAIEAAIAALTLDGAPLPPAVNFHAAEPGSPEAELRLVPERCRTSLARPHVALSTSFGFGGINAVLVLRRWGG